jgi:plasmid maintenance system antidote protein VapI
MNMEDIIRDRFRKSGLSANKLTRLAGTPYAAVHDFLAGKGTVTLPTAGKLCEVLGLVLVEKKKAR